MFPCLFAYLKPSHRFSFRCSQACPRQAGRAGCLFSNGCGRLGRNGMSHPFLSGSAEQQLLEEKRLDIGKKWNKMKWERRTLWKSVGSSHYAASSWWWGRMIWMRDGQLSPIWSPLRISWVIHYSQFNWIFDCTKYFIIPKHISMYYISLYIDINL